MTAMDKDATMLLRKRLLAALLSGLLVLGGAACDPGTTAEGGGTNPANEAGADTGATGEGFDEADVDEDEIDADVGPDEDEG